MLIKGVHHIAIIAGNYQASKHFYTSILGFEIIAETYRPERDSFKLDLSLDGHYVLELFSFPQHRERGSFPEATGLRHLAFSVTDLENAVAHLLSHGVMVQELRVDEITGKRFAFFSDPDAQPLELYEV
jgi:glyoxylase I family protein